MSAVVFRAGCRRTACREAGAGRVAGAGMSWRSCLSFLIVACLADCVLKYMFLFSFVQLLRLTEFGRFAGSAGGYPPEFDSNILIMNYILYV